MCSNRLRFLALVGLLTALVLGLTPQTTHAADEETTFDKSVKPFLDQHCVRCHGAKKPKARLMLHKLSGTVLPSDAKVWEAVSAQLSDGSMPPEGEPRPAPKQVAQVTEWIRKTLASAQPTIAAHELIYPHNGNHVPHDALFTPSAKANPATPARIWRVRPSIYESFVEKASRQPFHHPVRRESLFSTPWGLEGDGFKDYSDLYWIGEAETELLIGNAMRVANIMSRKRSKHADESTIFREFLRSKNEPTADERKKVIATGFEQILQRKPTAEEEQRYDAFLKKNLAELGREKGMETTLATLLLHPKALYRFELGKGLPDATGRVRLAPAELAYALAYTITDSPPDQQLLESATTGKLSTKEGIREQVMRILTAQQADLEKSQSVFVGRGKRRNPPLLRFFQEYFGYTKAPQVFKDLATKRKAKLGGNYSPDSLVADTNHLVLHFLKKDKDVLRELLTTNLAFVSTGRGRWNKLDDLKKKAKAAGRTTPVTPFDDKRNRINEHYNIEPSQWSENMPFPLDEKQRAGILTQPSWLIAHSTNFENHAIHRGKWIRERLLGGTIPNTPITVDAQLPDDESRTLRDKMRVTREAFCWKCHQQMDPLGLAFEMFDHFGRFRTAELGKPVDTTGTLQFPGEAKLAGDVPNALELMHKLGSSRYVQQVFVRHAFRFFLGRNETVEDAPTLIEADRVYTESGGSMKALVASLLSSDSFVYRTPQTPARSSIE